MHYKTILDAVFLSRPNRFIAKVLLDGKEETVHVKNTGRCKELLLPGAKVRLEVSENPARKTKYDLVAVRKEGLGWVNIDSQAPNKVVKEMLEKAGFAFSHASKFDISSPLTKACWEVDFAKNSSCIVKSTCKEEILCLSKKIMFYQLQSLTVKKSRQ